MRLERDHAPPVDIASQHDALVRRPLAGSARDLVQDPLLLAQVAGEVLERPAAMPGVLGDEHHVERRTVVDENLPVPVVDDAACRGDPNEADAVVLRELAHLRPAIDLEIPEPDAHDPERDQDQGRRHRRPHRVLGRQLARNDMKMSGQRHA
jgi:hypothetical protein